MKLTFMILVIIHLSVCSLVDDGEKRDEKREVNRTKCVLLSLLLSEQFFKDQGITRISRQELDDLYRKIFISTDTCQKVLNKKDNVD